jgi:hypothetical protein
LEAWFARAEATREAAEAEWSVKPILRGIYRFVEAHNIVLTEHEVPTSTPRRAVSRKRVSAGGRRGDPQV